MSRFNLVLSPGINKAGLIYLSTFLINSRLELKSVSAALASVLFREHEKKTTLNKTK